jgi:plastocyanin
MFAGFHLLKRAPAMLALVSFCAVAGQTVEVTVKDYLFLPQEIRIKAGDTVKWINREKRTSHSVLFLSEGGFESERFFPDESWKRTFEKPGTYKYRCGPHEEMKGIIVVE